MKHAPIAKHARAYAEFFEKLTPHNLSKLEDCLAPEAHFKDPFNDVRGSDRIRAIFEHMFLSCSRARFRVLEISHGETSAYLRWDFEFALKRWRPEHMRLLQGVSRVEFNDQGKVTDHVDYWDAAEQVYERIPILGAALRFIKRRLAIP